ncbi:MAG: UDP-galactose-lipid carrier transferase [Planctomycetes bacterium]|nr:UDP-galactose-lipid carrier transferase [Planctomycetota bacterium]
MALTVASIDLSSKIEDKQQYEERQTLAQMRMLLIQRWMFEHKREALLVFEGADAAGKGGSIRRLIERLDPRGYIVHPIGAPSSRERGRHYLQRFWDRIPEPGCIAIFDRSWYGRVLVERVEKFATKHEWKRAYEEINAFERMLDADNVPILKFYLHISKAEQLRRFRAREEDPFKKWKIGPEDWRNRKRWSKYITAVDDMFEETSTEWAPWHAVAAERKWFARVTVLETAVKTLSRRFDIDVSIPKGWKLHGD